MTEPSLPDLSAEDQKLVTLARATRGRSGGAEGAAVRDSDGRTYAAATVALPSLQVSALGVCVAMAVSSGSRGLEAAVLLTDAGGVSPPDLAALRDFGGAGVVVHTGDVRGTIARSSVT
jgi:hypothetical protein